MKKLETLKAYGMCLGVLVVLIISVFITGVILRGLDVVSETELLVNTIFVPNGYWDKFAKSEVAFSSKGLIAEVEFVNKYPGDYVMAIELGKKIYYPEKYEGTILEFKVEIIDSEKLIKSVKVNRQDLGLFTTGSLLLFFYSVPYELPEDKQLTCRIVVDVADAEFDNKFGPFMLYATKISDL